ncbi:conserved hypothetical protein [Leishmania major strain Friedlin]|uniref:Uncharacterized protein n=1 Tax=Leishmania major TaxID=5664 RepID=Q4QIB2_LEIMA|nr:conserved hypothetical protein [Leishmania major strain Friedlin]CAG9569355.1 hypothetical_protein_-_conserved [Leishmania major strain Friedlin]CAJ02236.1 conserved hypothetical protein [Leishmania major strain Friedlin]|eukprot:XP_001681086.1 conserved hypothetical protein [Leishmania major strain Friedlin]
MTTPSAMMAVAQGSASAVTGICSYAVWVTTLPPSGGAPIVYPPGAVAYQPQNHTIPPANFFLQHWYVPIILILCAVCGFYILLALWVIYRFDLHAQHQAKKVVGESYATKGYFNLDGEDGHGAPLPTTALAGAHAARSRGLSLSSVQSSSYSDDSYEDESLPSLSEADDSIIEMNPLQR